MKKITLIDPEEKEESTTVIYGLAEEIKPIYTALWKQQKNEYFYSPWGDKARFGVGYYGIVIEEDGTFTVIGKDVLISFLDAYIELNKE